MNFDFSEDQRRLQEEVRRVLGDHSTSANVRRVLEGEASYCADTWRELAALGALGIAIPEEHGGAGMGLLELCLIAEEAGKALAAVPLLGTVYLAAEALKRHGSAEQQAKWLPGIAGGEAIFAAALGLDTQHVLKAEPLRVEGGKLYGVTNGVPDAMIAQAALVRAGDALVVVDLSGAGVTRTAQTSLDPTRRLGQLRFDGAEADIVLATGGKASAETLEQGAAVLLAFEQVGGAERAMYAARDYVMERRAFGRIVGSFQAVKHKLAEHFSEIELARAHAYYGAWALATGAAELPRAAAAARVAATDAYNHTAEESLHLHGGIGYTWEVDCHLHVRRARWTGQVLGSRHLWTDRLAAQLIAEAA